MSLVLDERTIRQARARAAAASILDSPAPARRFAITDPRQLRGTLRRRLHGHTRPPADIGTRRRPGFDRRYIAAAAVVVQLTALVGVLKLPTFRLTGVTVEGNHLIPAATIAQTSGISPTGSVFLVDGDGARSRVAGLSWITSVEVTTSLPHTVRVHVAERTPVLRIRRTDGDLLVAAGGATIRVADVDQAAISPLPVVEDDRAPTPDAAASQPDATLLALLADTAEHFSATFGVGLSAFVWQPDGVLTIVATPGWRAILGRVDDPVSVGNIPAQLAALAALRSRVDLAHPTFGYVDLEDPTAPAVGGTPKAPPAQVPGSLGAATPGTTPRASATPPSSTPTPVPKPAPGPTPQPTKTPPPTPIMVNPG